MEDLLIYFAALIALGIVSHYVGIIIINGFLERCKSLEGFVRALLKQVYILIAIVLGSWLIVGEASILFTAFVAGLFVTFLRLDLDSVVEYYEK